MKLTISESLVFMLSVAVVAGYRLFATVKVWDIVAVKLGAPHITYAQAFCISILVSLFGVNSISSNKSSTESKDLGDLYSLLISSLAASSFAWAMVYWIMG